MVLPFKKTSDCPHFSADDEFRISTVNAVETIEFFMIRVSVRLSGRSKVTQNKINFVKNCPQWGWNPGPLDHCSNAQPTELGRICWAGDF